MENDRFFLLNPDNESLVSGASSRLPAGGQGCILLFMMSVFALAEPLVASDIAR